MKTKICSRCKVEKPLDDFSISRSRKDGRNHSCRECHNKYTRSHYKKNKDQYIKRNYKRTLEGRDYIIEFKKQSECCVCGESRWWVLDFHHDGDKKDFVGRLVTHGISIVKKEIEKCIVLCANCHRDLHYKEKMAL